jgi:tetratricopeptide (TPR) repeat protein
MLPDGHLQQRVREIEGCILGGRVDVARTGLAGLEERYRGDASALLHLAELNLRCEGHADAYRCYAGAAALAADTRTRVPALYGMAITATSLGRIDEAQRHFESVIALDPLDADAYVNRSSLRTWTAGRNNIDELAGVLHALPVDHAGRVALNYALAKELEDLGEAARSWEHLAAGARQRRAQMSYRVEGDVQTMADIAQAFDGAALARRARPVAPEPSIFVIGLPRSGTTLVDRILGSHSAVAGLGEVNTLVFSLMQLAAGGGGKRELVRRSAAIDVDRMGQMYRAGTASYGLGARRLTNKTPANFLYLGLIHQALPGSPVVHVTRHPLDSCYAMLKTLFRMGYPYSYSLEDLGHYYLAYARLMAHWRSAIPGSFIDLAYEDVVADQEGSTRRLLDYCGLPFEPGCLEFHKNDAPTATASAAQVRRPLYASSVGRWKAYERQLAPLADFLTDHGVDCAA